MCVARISMWDKVYPAVLLENIYCIVTSAGIFGDVLVDVLAGLFKADLRGELPDPGDALRPIIASALCKALSAIDHDCKHLLYDTLISCLQRIGSQQDGDENPESKLPQCHAWFVYVVRDVLMERFQDIVETMYEKGFSAKWVVRIEEVEKDMRIVLGEPVQLLCRLLLNMAFRGIDKLGEGGIDSGIVDSDSDTWELDGYDNALVSCVSCMIFCLCSQTLKSCEPMQGAREPYQLQIKILVWAELILLVQVLVAELVSSVCLNQAVIKELGSTLEHMGNLAGIKQVEELPMLLGNLVFAHQTLWNSIGINWTHLCVRVPFFLSSFRCSLVTQNTVGASTLI